MWIRFPKYVYYDFLAVKANFFLLGILLNLQSNSDNDTNVFAYWASGSVVVLSTQKPMETNYVFKWLLATAHAQTD